MSVPASSARIIAEAERAALIAQSIALKQKHALEVQQEHLKHRQEEMVIDAEIDATTAKIDVLNGSGNQCIANPSNGMIAYCDRGTVMSENGNTLNPHAWEFVKHKFSAQGFKESKSAYIENSTLQNSSCFTTANLQYNACSTQQ